MGWLVHCEGEDVEIPFDVDWIVDKVDGRLPDDVVLTMDKKQFDQLAKQAEWTAGFGNYATLAYCRGLTIIKHQTKAEAIEAKRCIDYTGCGGACCRVHLIVEIDPLNSRRQRELENIRRYMRRSR